MTDEQRAAALAKKYPELQKILPAPKAATEAVAAQYEQRYQRLRVLAGDTRRLSTATPEQYMSWLADVRVASTPPAESGEVQREQARQVVVEPSTPPVTGAAVDVDAARAEQVRDDTPPVAPPKPQDTAPPVAKAPSAPKPQDAAPPAPSQSQSQSQSQSARPSAPSKVYKDPVQAALWQARTDALQKYYTDQNWGSAGANELGGVWGSYVNYSTHKKNGRQLAYDSSKGEWVDVTPMDIGDDAAWRAVAGKDYKDQAKRWAWAWDQAHPAGAAPTRAEGMDDAAWEAAQDEYQRQQATAKAEREAALERQKTNTALIAQSAKDDKDLFGPGRTWFGGEPGSSSMGEVIGSLGRPRVVSDVKTKRLIGVLRRRF